MGESNKEIGGGSMAGSPTGLEFYYTPFTGKFDNGTVVLLHTKDEGAVATCVIGAIYYNNQWNNLYCYNRSVYIESINLDNGILCIQAYTYGYDAYISVFQTENFPTE